MKSQLAAEMETFHRVLPGLLADPEKVGKFVLIRGDAVQGVYGTLDDAIDAGYITFGNVLFLAKRIAEHEELLSFPRMIYADPAIASGSPGSPRSW